MMSQWLVGLGLLTVLGAEPSAGISKADLKRYEELRSTVAPDAAAQVNLALWCEARGLSTERVKHLAHAVLTDPSNARARGLMGLVEYAGRWQGPDAVARKVKADEALSATLAEYNTRRNRMSKNAEAHWKLAVWCEGVGLDAEARAHFSVVTQRDPSREAAWKRLGFKKVEHRWMTDAQVAAEKADADARKKADQHWKPLLTKWQGWLRHKDKTYQDKAIEQLETVTDPRAVPTVWAVFGTGDEANQKTAVQTLGQIDSGGASRALALLTVQGKTAEVRRLATEILKRRDPRDFVGLLIGMIRDPLKYEVKPGAGPGLVGELFVEGARYDVRRHYGFTPMQWNNLSRGSLARRIGWFDPSILTDPVNAQIFWTAVGPGIVNLSNGHGGTTPAVNLTTLAARRELDAFQEQSALRFVLESSRQQLADDVKSIEDYNAEARLIDDRLFPALSAVTGVQSPGTSDKWTQWWSDQQGYVYDLPTSESKPTLTQFVQNPVVPSHTACFAAGTPVRTLNGPRPIESIRVGDRLLSQDTMTGRLIYKPVLAVFHNKPAPTFKISVGGETVVATGIHRFWKAGQGWVMARDLKTGDTLRTLEGARTVDSVETDRVQPVFNLQVADGQSFLVGKAGLLVHDNSIVNPVAHPFDVEPSLASLSTER